MTTALAVNCEPVRVWSPLLPERRCAAALCPLPTAGHAVFLERDWSQLHVRDVCGGHIALIRDGKFPAIIYPLDTLPPLEALMAAVNGEISRRMAARQQAQVWATNTAFGTTTGSFQWTWAS